MSVSIKRAWMHLDVPIIFDSWVREREFAEKISHQSYVFLRFFLSICIRKNYFILWNTIWKSVEVYRGRNLHHSLASPSTDRDRQGQRSQSANLYKPSQMVTDPITIVIFYINSKIDRYVAESLNVR
jgi:hypothetical protein